MGAYRRLRRIKGATDPSRRRRKHMMASITPVTYYDGIAWFATTLPNDTRTVQPLHRHGSGALAARTVIRYYRRPGRPHANGI